LEAGLQWALGREEEAQAALTRAEDSLASFPSLPDTVHLASIRGRLRTRGRAPGRGSSPEDGLTLEPDSLPVVLREIQLITLARLALDQGRPGAVVKLCEASLATAEEAGRQARVIEARLLAALALAAQGKGREAQATLAHSLSLAEPEGYRRLYLDEGQPAAALLAAFLDDPVSPEHLRSYVADLLAAFERGAMVGEALLEPLSERELEVMRLVAQGLSNQKIAGHLYITLHTVKKHTSNIYGKLGVSSRTQAVARARELGLF
jgi:LuxR family maltose regulon positive regulatory protein